MFRLNFDRMKKIPALIFLVFFSIYFASCAVDSEYMSNLPEITGFKIKKIFRINRKLLASYSDSSGNHLFFKLNEKSAKWNRILFKTKVSF